MFYFVFVPEEMINRFFIQKVINKKYGAFLHTPFHISPEKERVDGCCLKSHIRDRG